MMTPGVRYRVTAHYPKLADQKIEFFTERKLADAAAENHRRAGANVELVAFSWEEVRRDLAFYYAHKAETGG